MNGRRSLSFHQLFKSTPNLCKRMGSLKYSPAERKSHIGQFMVIHPLLDRLLELKMAKCLQHGQVRAYQSQKWPAGSRDSKNEVEAPFIEGSMKVISLKPPTPSLKIDQKPKATRPKTTYTIIRSRTSEPRIRKKLEFINNNQCMYSEEDELKPSLFSKK